MWILPISWNTGADKGSLREVVCVNYRQLSIVCIARMPKEHTRICCDRFCTFVNWCLLFCYDNAVIVF